MADNMLTELMDEFGVRVEMSAGDDDTVSQVLMDMLTEIHRLRNQAAERTTPMPSDEELGEIVWRAMLSGGPPPSGAVTFGQVSPSSRAACIAAGAAVREAITAAQLLTVPEIPEGWRLWKIVPRWDDGYVAELESHESTVKGKAPTWQEALAAAIVETGEGEISV